MSIEIERKYLLKGMTWKEGAESAFIRQGFLSTDGVTVRVRTIGEEGFLTIKGPTHGVSRLEFEYSIPIADAERMLDELCPHPLIEKTRYRIRHGDLVWEVDEFSGDNEGLVLAEVELSHEDEAISLPEWIGEEVSGDPRYFNSNLSVHPYTEW
jgi:CYTH domain-containing protein